MSPFPYASRSGVPVSALAPIGARGEAAGWSETWTAAKGAATKENFIAAVFGLGLLLLLV